MDNRDEIIRTQLDVIGTLINNNIRRMSDDIWGAPPKPAAPSPALDAAQKSKSPVEKPAAESESTEAEQPQENIDDLKAELNELIGLSGIKREVNNLINMVTVHNLRRQETASRRWTCRCTWSFPAIPARARR